MVSPEREPQDAVNLTLTYRDLNNYFDGLKIAKAQIAQAPDNEDLHYVAAFLLFHLRQFPDSINELATAFRLKQDDWRVHQLFALNFIEQGSKQSDSYAEQELARAIKLNGKNAELYYELSRLYYTEQRFSESVAAASRAIAISPNYAEAYDNLALGYQAMGDIPRAVEGFSRAINLTAKAGNGDPWPYIDYAALLEDQSPGAAIPLLRQATAIDPRNAEANYRLGRCLNDVGQLKEAQAFYEQAITIDPTYQAAYYGLAVLLRTTDPARSADLLKKYQALRSQKAAQPQGGTPHPG